MDNEKINQKLDKIKHKIVVLSGKGGVGKSTVSTNLALALSKEGYKVELLDADIHGPSIPKMLGLENQRMTPSEKGIEPVNAQKNLKVVSMAFLLQDRDSPVIWRGPLKMGVIKQFLGDVNWGDLDFLFPGVSRLDSFPQGFLAGCSSDQHHPEQIPFATSQYLVS